MDSLTEIKYKKTHFDTIDSTNEEARRRFLAGACEPELLWADEQTAGKGRNGRAFYSPQNTGIYFTFLYPNPEKKRIEDMVFVTTVAAVSVCEALIDYAHVDAGIKWINDIYVRGRKVCGILAEVAYRDGVPGPFIGIGINLTTEDFPEEIAGIASGVGRFSAEELVKLKEKILKKAGDDLYTFFSHTDDQALREEIIRRYKANSLVLGKDIMYSFADGAKHPAKALDILPDGSLLVNGEEGEVILNSGEIHLHL